MSVSAIPGLHQPPTMADLEKSRDVFNSLTLQDEMPTEEFEMPEEQLLELGSIFVRHGVSHLYGLHLIHSHTKLPSSSIMFGHAITEPSGYWNKPTPASSLVLGNARGHVFKLIGKHQFSPYEFVEEKPREVPDTISTFIVELADCLCKFSLQDMLGLQILSFPPHTDMLEFDLSDSGTVMLQAKDAKSGGSFRTTGWSFVSHDGIISAKGQDVHAKTTRDTHRVFTGSKPLPDIESLKNALRFEDILR